MLRFTWRRALYDDCWPCTKALPGLARTDSRPAIAASSCRGFRLAPVHVQSGRRRPARSRPRRLRHAKAISARRGILTTLLGLPAGGDARADRRHHPVQSGQQPRRQRDRRRRERSPTSATHLRRDRRVHHHRGHLRRAGPPPRRSRRARRHPALFRRPSCRAAPTSSPSASASVGLHFADGQLPRPAPPAPRTSQVLRSAATLPEDVRRQITRERQAGEPDAAIDPMADPGGPRRGRPRPLRGAARLPADPDQLRYNATR